MGPKMDVTVIGVDVGGTNCDAMVVPWLSDPSTETRPLSAHKSPASPDVITGVADCVSGAVAKLGPDFDRGSIRCVAVGTTHFLNAVLQRRGLLPVGVVRLCGLTSHATPPFSGWHPEIRKVVECSDACTFTLKCNGKQVQRGALFAEGGFQFDKRTPLGVLGEAHDPEDSEGGQAETQKGQLCREEIFEYATEMASRGVNNFAVTGVFVDSLNPSQEHTVGEWIREAVPSARVTLGHQIGPHGILERENGGILNASLRPLALRTLSAFETAIRDRCDFPNAELLLTCNDGTVCQTEQACEYPIFCFSSGGTNSMRGGASMVHPSARHVIVQDIGGTTTDVGVVTDLEPRERVGTAELGGVVTNLHVPEVFSFSLGTGTVFDLTTKRLLSTSVALRLSSEAIVYGGNTCTTTDLMIARKLRRREPIPEWLQGGGGGRYEPDLLLERVSEEDVVAGYEQMLQRMLSGIDAVHPRDSEEIEEGRRMRVYDLVLVGGGTCLIEAGDLDCRLPEGIGRVIVPEHYAVANAFGATMLSVSASLDTSVENYTGSKRAELREQIGNKVRSLAVEKRHADPLSVREVRFDERKLAYLNNGTVRLSVRMAGRLMLSSLILKGSGGERHRQGAEHLLPAEEEVIVSGTPNSQSVGEMMKSPSDSLAEDQSVQALQQLYKEAERPVRFNQKGEWVVSERDIEFIAIGAGVLGSGGGGDPYHGKLRALATLRGGRKICVAPRERFEGPEHSESLFVNPAYFGSPDVEMETSVSGTEGEGLLGSMEEYKGVACAEIGGLNSIEPMVIAALAGKPVLDCDGMGRAFPRIGHWLPCILGHPLAPCGAANFRWRHDDKCVVRLDTEEEVEDRVRSFLKKGKGEKLGMGAGEMLEIALGKDIGKMGGFQMICLPALRGADLVRKTVPRTISLCWQIGRAVVRSAGKPQGGGGVEDQKGKDDFFDHSPAEAIVKCTGGRVLVEKAKVLSVVPKDTARFTIRVVALQELEGKERKFELIAQNEFVRLRELHPSEELEEALRGGGDTAKCAGKTLGITPDLLAFVDSRTGLPHTTERVHPGTRGSVLCLCSPQAMETEEALQAVGPSAFGFDQDTWCSVCEHPDSFPRARESFSVFDEFSVEKKKKR
uniref:Hydantoinase A/oxoprolinase domain-containing protein n=1 Tax=Chromera velia CCMP2878 TaxID=1169474 RepID=A0A0G4I508_9ALVE|eukprot:Cvel_10983.t1-p1 / transcript=Cvel_10983.t1 / gene=Cvel_10983 / organism=Chromera_velia_CCMP2878 / gene_product=hypothetical protein / transcript_product=hypothetical protein / location=Cvel_scaffold676:770-4147(-) / protein_length=1126 / sequence_SO=supercontig / SO=protein_coding / is_pseudo=false